jgi:hypothetical protein
MCYLSENLQNTSYFVTLFSDHGDVMVGFAIFHIVLFQKRKKEKRKEKRHSSMVCESWWVPDGIGYPWFVKGKVGRSAKLYKSSQRLP